MTIDASEIWKPVVGFEGTYEVSILGVRSKRGRNGTPIAYWRTLKPGFDTHGYRQVTLYLRGKRKNFLVAHLVADAFLPPKKPTDQVLRHLNDDPTDNRIENLAWGTYSDNMADAIRNDKIPRGVAHYCAKLTEENVREIRRLYATGNFTQQDLALKFGVAQGVISDIVKRKKWKHVA